MRMRLVIGVVLAVAGPIASARSADIMPLKAAKAVPQDEWTGFYAGAHLGYGWGRSNWSEAPDLISGSFNLAKSVDMFTETGSFFAGLQAGYDYMFANRVVLGVVVDASAPSFQNQDGISIGGLSHFNSASLGPQTFAETMLMFGSIRARVGYAPGHWLFYATG